MTPWAGVATSITWKLSPSGSKSLPATFTCTDACPRSCGPRRPGDGGFVGVAGGEDADGDGALGDVAVGVGDEVVELVVGADRAASLPGV